jgi:hypothetical protein
MVRYGLVFCVLVLTSVLFAGTACSDLGGAKGKVENALTGKPVEGVQIVATTESNIEDGYGSTSITVDIPPKSNVLIKDVVKLCPSPTEGRGVYAYANGFIKLPEKPYQTASLQIPGTGSKWPFVYYDEDGLKDIPHIRSKYIVFYQIPSASGGWQRMLRLWRHSVIENFVQSPESDGQYYSVGSRHSQWLRAYGSFNLVGGIEKMSVQRISGSTSPETFWGNVPCRTYFSEQRPHTTVCDIEGVPSGYYFFSDSNGDTYMHPRQPTVPVFYHE